MQLRRSDSLPELSASSARTKSTPPASVHVDALSWYTRTSLAALLFQLNQSDSYFKSTVSDTASHSPKVLSELLATRSAAVF